MTQPPAVEPATDDALVAEVVRRHLRNPVEGEWTDQPLMDSGFDSLAAIELVVELEDTLGLTFPDEVLVRETFETLGTLTATVRRLRTPS